MRQASDDVLYYLRRRPVSPPSENTATCSETAWGKENDISTSHTSSHCHLKEANLSQAVPQLFSEISIRTESRGSCSGFDAITKLSDQCLLLPRRSGISFSVYLQLALLCPSAHTCSCPFLTTILVSPGSVPQRACAVDYLCSPLSTDQ